jgi:hypothetical protein
MLAVGFAAIGAIRDAKTSLSMDLASSPRTSIDAEHRHSPAAKKEDLPLHECRTAKDGCQHGRT